MGRLGGASNKDLPLWETRIRWWAANGAGRGTPHVPHQWGERGTLCAQCGAEADPFILRPETPLAGTVFRGRWPPACRKHAASVGDAFVGAWAAENSPIK